MQAYAPDAPNRPRNLSTKGILPTAEANPRVFEYVNKPAFRNANNLPSCQPVVIPGQGYRLKGIIRDPNNPGQTIIAQTKCKIRNIVDPAGDGRKVFQFNKQSMPKVTNVEQGRAIPISRGDLIINNRRTPRMDDSTRPIFDTGAMSNLLSVDLLKQFGVIRNDVSVNMLNTLMQNNQNRGKFRLPANISNMNLEAYIGANQVADGRTRPNITFLQVPMTLYGEDMVSDISTFPGEASSNLIGMDSIRQLKRTKIKPRL